jgi:hypothetical protein
MDTQQLGALPTEQVHAFWDSVEETLRTKYKFTGDQPIRAILRYRNEIDRVGPNLYHREPADIADDIVSGEYAQPDRKVG